MPSVTGRFRRTDRILRSKGFRRVMGRGERTSSRNFVVFIAGDECNSEIMGPGRIGITVSKRVGNAVVRNHIKRGIREWYRDARRRLPMGAEIVVIARRPSRDLPTKFLFEDLDQVLVRHRAETEKAN